MYEPKLKLYRHQQEALTKMSDKPAFALLMAMRTGKSATLLANFGMLEQKGQVQDLLIIAPAGVYATWLKAIDEHVSDELRSRLLIHKWSASATKAEQRDLHWFMNEQGKPRILLVNVEALSSVKRAKDICTQFLGQRSSMCVIDESTVIKSPTSQRTKFINGTLAPLAKYRRILTGLVAPNSPLDVYAQFQFLGPKLLGFSSFYAFRARYAVTKKLSVGGRSIDIVVSYRDVDELRSRIEPHSFRVRLEECYEIRDPIYTVRHVEMTDEQKRVYNDLKNFASAQLEGEEFVSAQQVITQILRMHQVLCGHTRTEEGVLRELSEHRTSALLELLGEYDGKAIIWCSYDHDIRKVSSALEKEYGKGSVARFWGGNRSTREDEEAKFFQSPDCRFMVATAAAGGRGRTWVQADLVIYYSNTHDLEHRAQSEERPKGVGKTCAINYVDLMVLGTVDEKIISALRNKINIASTISGDTYKSWLI
jgi:SNF2 family DNA or RNA helicase